MQAIAIGDPGRLLVSLSHGFMQLHCANMAERIEVLLGVETLGGPPRNIVLNGNCDPPPRRFDVVFTRLVVVYSGSG